MSDLDLADFKMTRLSDIIVKGTVESSNSEINEIKLAELENLIKQIKQNQGVETKPKGKITQEEKCEPLKDTKVKFKKTMDELLLVGKSPICRMPPSCWEEVVKKLPTVLIKHVYSRYTVPRKNQQGEEYMNSEGSVKFLKRSSLHEEDVCKYGGIQPIQEANLNDVKKPHKYVKEKDHQTNLPQTKEILELKRNDGEILQAGNKNSFINYLMFPKQKRNPSLQSNFKLENASKSLAKNEENGSSLKSRLVCSICKELCKRGVSMPCCDAKACRYCAVKNLTDYVYNANRKCWSCSEGPVATMDLVVDDNLREAIQEFINAETKRNRNCQMNVKCCTDGEVNGSKSEEDAVAKFQFDF